MTNDLLERFKRKKAPLKAEEIMEAGYTYKEIGILEANGEIKRFKNGYYTCPEVDISEEDMVIAMFPDGVFTMETALYYHGYISSRPYHWSVAISKNASKSRFKLDYPIIHPFYAEPKVLAEGVMKMELPAGEINIYEKDRLICEMMKYEDKMDRDDFKQALLSYITDKERDISKLLYHAEKRRVLKKTRSIIGVWI